VHVVAIVASDRGGAHERQDGELALPHRDDRIRHPLYAFPTVAHGAQLLLTGPTRVRTQRNAKHDSQMSP